MTDHQSSKDKDLSKDFGNDEKETIRRDILRKALSNVCSEAQYLKILKQLYDLERRDLGTLDEYVFLNDVL